MSSNSNLFIPLSNFANTKYLYKYDCFQLLSGGGNCREKPFPNRATMSLNVTYGLIVFFLFATLLYIQYFTCFFFRMSSRCSATWRLASSSSPATAVSKSSAVATDLNDWEGFCVLKPLGSALFMQYSWRRGDDEADESIKSTKRFVFCFEVLIVCTVFLFCFLKWFYALLELILRNRILKIVWFSLFCHLMSSWVYWLLF